MIVQLRTLFVFYGKLPGGHVAHYTIDLLNSVFFLVKNQQTQILSKFRETHTEFMSDR